MSLSQSNDSYGEIIAFYEVDLKYFEMNPHEHLACEIMYVKKGHCQVSVGSNNFTLRSGEFIFLDSYFPHCLIINSQHPCNLLNIEFMLNHHGQGYDFSAIRNVCPELNHTQSPRRLLDQGDLGTVLLELVKKLTQQRMNSNASAFDDLTIQLLFQRMLLELGANFRHSTSSGSSSYVKQAKEYIHEHLIEELSIHDIAASVGINHSYLQALFKQQTAQTIVQYIQQQRIQQACFLLINSSLSVTDIAFEVGFNSRQHFGKTFDQIIGSSPHAFRKKYQRHPLDSLELTGQFRKETSAWYFQKMD